MEGKTPSVIDLNAEIAKLTRSGEPRSRRGRRQGEASRDWPTTATDSFWRSSPPEKIIGNAISRETN